MFVLGGGGEELASQVQCWRQLKLRTVTVGAGQSCLISGAAVCLARPNNSSPNNLAIALRFALPGRRLPNRAHGGKRRAASSNFVTTGRSLMFMLVPLTLLMS